MTVAAVGGTEQQVAASAWVIIAARGGGEAKSRLAGRLTPAERGELAVMMLDDMLRALRRCERVEGVLVTTPTPALAAVARRWRAQVLGDGGFSLNVAFAGAQAWVGEGYPGAATLLLPGDLPRLDPREVDAMIAVLQDRPSILAATHDGGTGAWALRAGAGGAPMFGAGSARRHLAQIEGGVLAFAPDYPSLSGDIDTPDDLDALASGRGGAADFVRARVRRLAS